MIYDTEEILGSLTEGISRMAEVQAIGLTTKFPLPKAGQGDIDVFIYCDRIPTVEAREAVISQHSSLLKDCKINVFEGGHWGTGDFVQINGVETWLMYCTVQDTINDAEAILSGEYPDKLDNYYYPVGRLAMLSKINILFDRDGFLGSLKNRLSAYPDDLAKKLIQYHLDKLDDMEDLERAVTRKDVLFYHFAIDIALDHFLQALFAINKIYFPSRKRSFEFINEFEIKPKGCIETLSEVIRSGSCPEGIDQSYHLWKSITKELQMLGNDLA